MADILVAYFSRSGTTEALARELARLLRADLDEVRPKARFSGPAGFVKGVWHALRRRTPPVEFARKTAGYSFVVIASPVWAGRLSSPMAAYLKANRGHLANLAAVCVSGSGGAYPAVFAQVERLCGRPVLASLALAQRDVLGGGVSHRLRAFADGLRSRRRRAA